MGQRLLSSEKQRETVGGDTQTWVERHDDSYTCM